MPFPARPGPCGCTVCRRGLRCTLGRYITLPDGEDEDHSDEEDFVIKPTDAILLACRTEEELSNLEVSTRSTEASMLTPACPERPSQLACLLASAQDRSSPAAPPAHARLHSLLTPRPHPTAANAAHTDATHTPRHGMIPRLRTTLPLRWESH